MRIYSVVYLTYRRFHSHNTKSTEPGKYFFVLCILFKQAYHFAVPEAMESCTLKNNVIAKQC